MKAVGRHRWVAPLLLLAGACSGGTKALSARFNGPGALVPFRGGAPSSLRQILAVANVLGDELRYVDPEAAQVLMSPGVVFPLSVPTGPRPTLLASAGLGDGGADLLVVVGAGSLSLELVKTWDDLTLSRVEQTVDLAEPPTSLSRSASVLALAADRVPGAPGRARAFAAISGGQLAVFEFSRGPTGSVQLDAVAAGAIPSPLPIEPLDIAAAVDPAAPDANQLLLATADPVALSGASYVYGAVRVAVPASAP
jgi:hypothetical protein